MRGLLCGCSSREIAEKLVLSRKGVEVYVCKTLYPYLKQLPDVPSQKIENWRNIDRLLEDTGYKRQLQSSVKSKTNSSLPIESLVKVVNLGVGQHTISIDINIKLALPSDGEDEKSENRGDNLN